MNAINAYDGTTPIENEIVKLGLCSENARATINDLINQSCNVLGIDCYNLKYKKYNAQKVACFQFIEAEARKGKTAKEIIRDCKVATGLVKPKAKPVKNDSEAQNEIFEPCDSNQTKTELKTESFEPCDSNQTKTGRGGFRKNSGMKSTGIETVTVRIDKRLLNLVTTIKQDFKNGKSLDDIINGLAK